MRLWSVSPRLLDPKGLVAVWREALLARRVLEGRTTGYRHHPQLERFRAQGDPVGAVDRYLVHVREEALRRGYSFDSGKIGSPSQCMIAVTSGQVNYEFWLLERKLSGRCPGTEWHRSVMQSACSPALHPAFSMVDGPIEPWERVLKG